ncbi:MAG TPA: KamA family radical SAM protein [Isosphaeraceae bacterium]|nr:KamA family radical SAM protein [Isosphaeraceae bacterium]
MGDPTSPQGTLVAAGLGVKLPDGDEPPSFGPNPNPDATPATTATPARSPRHPAWADVPDRDWGDWRWQSQHAVRTPRQLAELLPFSVDERRALDRLQAEYKLAIPPYYFSLIDRFDPADPIRLQSVPSPLELAGAVGTEEDDPLDEDKDAPVPGLTHRYPDRALLVTTHVCTMYCRFCTRKRATMKRGGWDAVSRDDVRMVEYVRDHPEIRDVIVSGGDPLTLPIEKLEYFVTHLAALDHVDVIRIGTRVPVTLPQRLDDDELIAVLGASDKVWIQTHFNHAREVTPEAARACKRLRMAGLPINNHAVLMKGVNDSLAAQRDLCRALLRVKVRPYYLFHCDPVTGAGHFRTSVWKGIEIVEGLRGHMSGLGVPTYVVDAPRGGGKIPMMPNYLVSAADDAVVLRNYEGMLVRYDPTGVPPEDRGAVATQGVSALLAGRAEALVPEGNPRHQRRRPKAEANGNGNGNGYLHANGNGKSNGNGNGKRRPSP